MRENYTELLVEKVSGEYRDFLFETALLPPERIIERSYEKVMKEEFVRIIEEKTMKNEDAKALYGCDNSLDTLYMEWLKNDYSYVDLLRDTVDDCLQRQKRLQKMRDGKGER